MGIDVKGFIVAFLVGVLLLLGLGAITGFLLVLYLNASGSLYELASSKSSFPTTIMFTLVLAPTALSSFTSGFFAAKVSKSNRLVTAIAVGILLALMALIPYQDQEIELTLLGLLIPIPFCCMGYCFFVKRTVEPINEDDSEAGKGAQKGKRPFYGHDKMNEDLFWRIVGMLNWDEAGDDDAVLEPAVDFLSKQKNEDIFLFEELLAQKLQALDTKAHAKEIGDDAYGDENTYFSVDGFLYSRCVVVANGKALFDQVLGNPADFPKDMEFEAILYLAQEAYEQKNDDEWSYISPTCYETFKNQRGWQ